MSAADWFKMLLRRWYVIVPVLIISAAGCIMVGRAVPATYEAQATVLLLQPPDPNVEGPQNPYLRFGGGLPIIANVLSQTMAGDQAQSKLASQGATGTIVAAGAPGRSPMVVVTAEALTAREAEHSLDIGITTLISILQDMQQEANAPRSTWVTMQLVARTAPDAPIRRAQIRAVIAVGGAGLVLSIALTLVAEMIARAGARRRSSRRLSWRRLSRTHEPGGSRDGVEPDAPHPHHTGVESEPSPERLASK